MDKKAWYVTESLRLFVRRGIRAVTMQTLSRHLNVSSKTLYQLFGDKTGLVTACVKLYQQRTLEICEQLNTDSKDAAEVLVKFYEQQVSHLSRVNPAFFQDISYYLPNQEARAVFFGVEETQACLRRGQAEGLLEKLVDVSIAAYTLTWMLETLFEGVLFEEQDMSYLLRHMVWPYLRGLCTEAGRAAFRRHWQGEEAY